MGKSLVIVESPAKAKTINKYLGKDFVVKSSVGHIRDLPTAGSSKPVDPKERARQAAITRKMSPTEKAAHRAQKNRAQLIRRMGIDPEQAWQARYEVLPGKEKVVDDLKKLAKDADAIYLATDLDREGEAIAWHLREAIGGDEDRYKRVVFNEITRRAIQEAFEHPGDLDTDRVNAQQARRFLDRVVGYMVSPLLWAKIARGLSAGRVQSVAVRLLVEREREIHAFIPEEFWELHADLRGSAEDEVRFQVVRQAGEKFRPTNGDVTSRAVAALEGGAYRVSAREDKPTQSKPSAPYITSTLQQAASTRLGFSVKKTMMLAQRLYEAGYITYMRTDSTNLSGEAVQACRDYISSKFAAPYLPEQPNVYSAKEGAQEAHEAIRPSDVNVMQSALKGMERDAERLYELIIIQFDGFTRVQPVAGKRGEDVVLPDLKEGDSLTLIKLDPSQHFTKPPPRYGEASLVRELEKRGIGRPSTYASIISTIQERGYVRLENKRFYAWKQLLDQFYADFSTRLQQAEQEDKGMRRNEPTMTDISCEQCARPMQVRTASTGVFLGCSGYALPPKERCKHTINLVSGDEAVSEDADDEAESRQLIERHRCPKCNTAMDSYLIDEARKLHVCGNNPDCDGFEVEQGAFRIKGYDGPVIECDKCGADMQLKTGRFGKYFGCTSDSCKNTRKLLRNGEPAPPKMDPVPMPELACQKVEDTYVLRDGAAGLFLAASQFPRNRETRAPFLDELLPHKEEIDPKYSFLFSGPVADEAGNRTQIRYSRKTREQYLMTEVDGKATGWRAFHDGGTWTTQAPKAASARKSTRKKAPRKKRASR
jgi:DNA topoisomerase-1